MFRIALVLVLPQLLLYGCDKQEEEALTSQEGVNDMSIKVTSTAFEEGTIIPAKYTCDGDDVSPPLAWKGVPEDAESIALICDDPDAPMGTWVHWVVWNMPADKTGLEEGIASDRTLPDGTRQGMTDFKKTGYGGPCPPSGTHRYYFKVYALDTKLDIDGDSKKSGLVEAMEGHILAEGRIMGKYKR